MRNRRHPTVEFCPSVRAATLPHALAGQYGEGAENSRSDVPLWIDPDAIKLRTQAFPPNGDMERFVEAFVLPEYPMTGRHPHLCARLSRLAACGDLLAGFRTPAMKRPADKLG